MSHYHRWRRNGDPLIRKRVYNDDEVRWWSKVDKRGPDECWPWTDPLTKGYGRFVVRNEYEVGAHRWGYLHLVGPIPEGLDLDHLCHTHDPFCAGGADCLHRRCCNPVHLEPVTPEENGRRAGEQHRMHLAVEREAFVSDTRVLPVGPSEARSAVHFDNET
jgi:hypothetical protein